MNEGHQSKWVKVMPEKAYHSKNGSNVVSSWTPNNDAHGIIRSIVGTRACCQCLVALWLGKLFTVIIKITKYAHTNIEFCNAQIP